MPPAGGAAIDSSGGAPPASDGGPSGGSPTGGAESTSTSSGGGSTSGIASGGVPAGGNATGGTGTGGAGTGGSGDSTDTGGTGTGGAGTGGSGDSTDPWAQAARLGRGVNLGNMLEAPTEGEWGETAQEEYLALIAGAGFTNVRIPVRWNAHAATTTPYTIDGSFLARVDQVVGWALDAGLAVILNIHHYEELWANPEAERPRFLGLWEQIATHFASAPSVLMLEVVNEPTWDVTPATVNALLADAVGVIRQSNPNRTILLGGPGYNAPASMESLAVPPDESNIIGTFHMYEPFDFTHSGAEWLDPVPAAGATWNGTAQETQLVDEHLGLAIAWSNATGLPVHMGEFGAYSLADQASRARWTSYVVERAVALDIPFSYWEFCSGFGVYDNETATWDQDIRGALLE